MLVAVLALMLAIGAAWWIRGLGGGGVSEQRHTVQTSQALTTAKEALLAYAQTQSNTPGALPCPVTEAGTAVADCSISSKAFPLGNTTVKIIGRVPWKTLGIDAPKNGGNDCLWMLLYMPMRTPVSTINRSEFPVSASAPTDKTQSLWLEGNAYPALLISPLPATAGQVRTWTTGSTCSSGSIASYLDASTGDKTVNTVSQTFDVRPISMNELLRPTLKRVLEPLSLSCARSLTANYPTSTSISSIRNADLSKSSLVDAFDLALGGCDQIEKCSQVLASFKLDLQHYDPQLEQGLSLDDKEMIKGWCTLYRDKNDAALTAGSCPVQTHSADSSLNTPPFWLCHNGWYDLIQYNKDDQTLSISLNTTPPYKCTTQLSSGEIQCK
ncbi:hypothetical protein [Uliginosibacterium flavum]|uniref:Uncharacterized protein n=1 Tax=Uliginosibacterium flavum TaxID=1396831 RepID=A0ABV2TP46_9RHOO